MYNRRIFLQCSGLAAGALAVPELLRAQAGTSSLPSPVALASPGASGPDLPLVQHVELQPLVAQVQRLLAATDYLGPPLRPAAPARRQARPGRGGKHPNATE
jgi:hypothetical protein